MVAEICLAVGALFGAFGIFTGIIDFEATTQRLPFASPVFAGIALGVLIGVLPLAVALATLRRAPGAVLGHLVVGLVLMGWIGVQVAFIGLGSWLQVGYAAFGGLITALAVWNLSRLERRHRVLLLQRWVINPPMKAAAWLGWARGHVLVETVGRHSGRRHLTVVGMRTDNGTGWVVAEQGRHADYVRNIATCPLVRVRVAGYWRPATAWIVDGDDAEARLDSFGSERHATAVRRFGTDLLTLRFDFLAPIEEARTVEPAVTVESIEPVRVR